MPDAVFVQALFLAGIGFVLGAVARPYFLDRPVIYFLIAGTVMFVTRFIPQFIDTDNLNVGNGLIVELVLLWVYGLAMVFGNTMIVRRYYRGR